MSTMFTRRGFLRQSRNVLLAAGTLSGTSAVLSACGGQQSSGPVTVTYRYADFNNASKDVGLVQTAMNKILEPLTGANIKLMPIPGGTFDQKMKLFFAARQQGDIVFTAPWVNNYYNLVSNGDLLDISDSLLKDAPQLYSSLTPAMWNAVRVNGKIYGVINQQIFVKPWGATIRKDLVEKYGFDINTMQKWEDLEPLMDKMKADGITPLSGDIQSTPFLDEYYGWDPIASAGSDVNATDKALKAFVNNEQPEYQQSLQTTYRWRQAGYFTKDAVAGADATTQFQAGKYGMTIGGVIKPGGDLEAKAKFGWDFVSKAFAKPILTTQGVAATMNGICKTSQNADAALKILNAINTNKEVYNLICKGIENKHWVFVDKAKGVIGFPPGVTAANSGYNPNTDWMFGNQFNAYYVSEDQVGSWEQTATLNRQAEVSVALGFSFIPDNVQTQIAQVTTVGSNYQALTQGRQNVATNLPKYLAALKQAGQDQILAEVQRQLDAWKAHKPQM